jgi:hypothetical protein
MPTGAHSLSADSLGRGCIDQVQRVARFGLGAARLERAEEALQDGFVDRVVVWRWSRPARSGGSGGGRRMVWLR